MPVAARFHELRDRTLAAVDVKFAEPVKLYFMSGGRTDQSRGLVQIEAVLRVGEGKDTNASGGNAQTWRSRLEAGKAELHINRTTYTGPQPVKGDRVSAIARHGEPLFEVLAVDDRSHTRLVLQLGEK